MWCVRFLTLRRKAVEFDVASLHPSSLKFIVYQFGKEIITDLICGGGVRQPGWFSVGLSEPKVAVARTESFRRGN